MIAPTAITDINCGLTDAQISQAPKNIPAHHVSDFELAFTVVKAQVFSFFFILLIVSGALSFFLGESLDAIIFLSIAAINAVVGFFQEFRANKSVLTLEKLVAHTVTVRRNYQMVSIESAAVVLGDIIVIEPGDIVVADMEIRESKDLFVDESVLTGETLPREVKTGDQVFSGACVVQGTALGQVIAVGKENSLLLYANKVSHVQKNSSFEKFIDQISRLVLIMTAICLALVLAFNVLVAHSMVFSEYILYAISMLVGVVPESLPLIITLILTREALLLARRSVIVKKLSVLENLGSMNFLFTDKTGTITENKLRVKKTIDQGGLNDSLSAIVDGTYERTPMDQVFDNAIALYLQKDLGLQKSNQQELVLSPFQLSRGFAVYTLPDGSEIIRGQYAAVSAQCQNSNLFSQECLTAETQGFRIIAIAAKTSAQALYALKGAVVFEDPLKDDALEMYRNIKNLGVDVKIITGDSKQVASYVGHVLDSSVTDAKVCCMDAPEALQDLDSYSVYAKCRPEQKSTLIDGHLQSGVVGFLGEGINDAMALKRADIGFVVDNASDVARQSGDVILLEKSLSPIVQAVEFSRRAFLHIRTYLLCTLTGNVGTLISLTAVAVFWQQIPMLPIQILLNNLLTDLPLTFLITDNIDDRLAKRPIRDEAKKFFIIIFMFALVSSLFDFIFFFIFKQYDIAILRTGWFVFSVIAELTLMFSLRSELSIFKSPKLSRSLLFVVLLCFVFAFGLPYLKLGSVFHLLPLSFAQVGILLGITVAYLCANEVVKKLFYALGKGRKDA